MEQNKKVYVGLSGGVDSALGAALLVKAGYDVTGVFIKIWQPTFVACTWKEDRLDAMRVAVALGIPFETLDLSDIYEREVISRMISDYSRGMTPNPDVLCNRFIKFGAFRTWAHAHGADRIATGHHAQVIEENGVHRLVRGVDPGKDQAYFLSQLSQDDLAHTLFPIGHLTKKEVREQARALDLPVAKRPDSQGLCFVGDVDMHDFLRELIKPMNGAVLDTEGAVIGEHDGAALYTLGQRHKFRVTGTAAAQTPQYVITINAAENTLTVAPDISLAHRQTIKIIEEHWTLGTTPASGQYTAEVRYHQKPQPCTFDAPTNIVTFETPLLAAPGQFLVLYDGTTCLGGGVIT